MAFFSTGWLERLFIDSCFVNTSFVDVSAHEFALSHFPFLGPRHAGRRIKV